MPKEKKSFFDRLTGTVRVKDEDKEIYNHESSIPVQSADEDADLLIDMYQTSDSIVIRAFVAGVSPEDLDINISREMVKISGERKPDKIAKSDDTFIEELFWGSFSRVVTLPQEVDVEESEAVNKNGLLIITMPKMDRLRETKLKVKG